MDLIIRAKNSYEQLMKRESHLFAQETKLISEFWNLKKKNTHIYIQKGKFACFYSPLLTVQFTYTKNPKKTGTAWMDSK